MKTVTKDEVNVNFENFVKKIKENKAVFLHPTDTIYGLGCDASSEQAIKKLRKIKQMPIKAISVIAPSKAWIYKNFEMNKNIEEWLDKLPGPYTFILKKRARCDLPENLAPGMDTIGVRMPDHWISELAYDLDKPICTTSANITGKLFMTNIDNLDRLIKQHLDFAIYEGEKDGKPSKIVNLSEEITNIKTR